MAGRKAPPTETVAPKLELTPSQIERGIQRLDERLADLEAFNVNALVEGRSPELTTLESAITETLIRCFGESTSAYKRYARAAKVRYISMAIGYGGQVDYRTPTKRNVGDAIALLKEAKRELSEDLLDHQHSVTNASQADDVQAAPSNRVFVVHGHDESALQGLARFLEKLGWSLSFFGSRLTKAGQSSRNSKLAPMKSASRLSC